MGIRQENLNSRLHETGGDSKPARHAKLGTLPANTIPMKILIIGLAFGVGTYAALCWVYFMAGL